MTQSNKARTAAPGVWVLLSEGLPGTSEDVRIRDIVGFEHLGRRNVNQDGWHVVEFATDVQNNPAISCAVLEDSQVAAWMRLRPTLETVAPATVKFELGRVFHAWYNSVEPRGDMHGCMRQAFEFGIRLQRVATGPEEHVVRKLFDDWYTGISIEGDTHSNMRRAFDYAISLYAQAEEEPVAPGTTHDWVRCPVCDEPDMHRTTEADGASFIKCVNGGCASNGGLNAAGLEKKLAEKQKSAPVSVSLPGDFKEAATHLVTLVELTLGALEEVHQARATTERVEGVALYLTLGTLNEAVEVQKAYERKLRASMSEFRVQLRIAEALKAPGGQSTSQKDQLVRDFLQMCIRRAGRQVSGDDLSRSATRLLARLSEL